MDIFDVYNFQNRVKNVDEEVDLEECLKLLGIVYFDGSLKKVTKTELFLNFQKVTQWQSKFDLWKEKYAFGVG